MRHPFLCVLAAALLPALAGASEDAIQKCRQADNSDARIACLEAALRGEALPTEEPAAESDAAAGSEPEVPVVEVAVSASAAAAATQVSVERAEGGAPDAVADAAEPPAPPVAAAAEATAPPTQDQSVLVPETPDGIGAEQVVARSMTREQQLAALASASNLKVARYSEVPYQRLVVHLENGQVWRQISGDEQHIRVSLRRNQTVDINESKLGGYKLQLNEMRRTIRVERVK